MLTAAADRQPETSTYSGREEPVDDSELYLSTAAHGSCGRQCKFLRRKNLRGPDLDIFFPHEYPQIPYSLIPPANLPSAPER